MAFPKMRGGLDALRNDASKVLDDITHLTTHFKDVSAEKTSEIKENLVATLEEQISSLKERLDGLSGDVRKYGMSAQKHMQAYPYLYLAGALGVGVAVGSLVISRRKGKAA